MCRKVNRQLEIAHSPFLLYLPAAADFPKTPPRANRMTVLSNTIKGAGAGIRDSKPRQPRSNKLEGDSSWQPLTYEFQVPFEEDEIQLFCELRAAKGEVWFDLDSLRLVKLK